MSSVSRLRFFPVSFFAMIMGLGGYALALERAVDILGFPEAPAAAMLALAALLFVLLALSYGVKLARFREEVIKELGHPVKLSFFPTFSISLILLGTALLRYHPGLSLALWAAGAALQLGFTLFVLSRWISHTAFEIQHSNPSWFIPVVGNILVPIAGVAHGFHEISWLFFSVGVLFWLVLFTIIFNRVIFHHPLPEKLAPTFFILIAPPAVGFIAYLQLAGGLDAFARVLYYSALFLAMLLAVLGRRLFRIRFYLSWWAYSFPTAAFTVASLLMFQHTGLAFYRGLSWLMMAALTGVIAVLLAYTGRAALRGDICVEE